MEILTHDSILLRPIRQLQILPLDIEPFRRELYADAGVVVVAHVDIVDGLSARVD